MVVRRDSLRAQTDFFSPMTGNTSPRFGGSPKGKYSDEVKSRMAGMGEVRSTRTNPIQAAFVELIKTKDPFTEIDTKKSYAPEEEEGLLEGLGNVGGSDVGERVEEFLEPITSGGGSGQRASQRRADQQYARQEKNPSSKTSTNELVARDNRMYGNTFPDGAIGINSKSTDDFSKDPRYQSTADPTSDPGKPPKDDPVKTRIFRGQGSSVNKLGATTQRQGNTVRDGEKGKSWGGPAVNLSNYQDNRDKQNALRTAAAQQKKLTDSVKATGIPTGLGLKAGSFGISQAGKDQAAINRGIAAAKKTGIPSQTAVQGGAMSQAAKDQAAINRGIAAAKATGIPSGDALKAGSFGISEKGKAEAAKNKAMAKAKAQAATKTSTVSTTTKQGEQRTKAQMAAAKRKASGTTSSQAKAANTASMKAAAAARHASFKSQKAAGTHARTASAQRARNKAAAKARAKAAAKRRRSKKKCDITIKYDISKLTDMNLLRDDLANVAYFVKELQETI